jgi:hypothetical protein
VRHIAIIAPEKTVYLMIEAIAQLLGSSAVGSAIGGVFGWLNRKEERKERESERKFQIEMLQAKANFEQLTSEARAFEESQKSKSGWSDVIKELVRPLITAALMYQVYIVLISLEELTGGMASLPAELSVQLYREIVLNIISLCATAVSWWFAARPSYRKK